MGWDFSQALAGWFLLGVSQTVVVRYCLGLWSSEGPTGLEVPDGSLMWLASDAGHPPGAQLDLTLEHLHVVSCCVGFSQHGSWVQRVCVLKGGIQRASNLDGTCKASDRALEVTQCHLYHDLL